MILIMLDLNQVKQDVITIAEDVLEKTNLQEGDIFVIGSSSSEVIGGVIGKNSSQEVGTLIAETLITLFENKNIYLAFQGCEHINRSLVIEREIAEKKDYEIVNVVPALHAGGAMSMAAYKLFKDPVMIEHVVAKAGLDIGDTSIGMHVKFVQVPVRLKVKEIGKAHLTALRSRDKLVGGERAIHY